MPLIDQISIVFVSGNYLKKLFEVCILLMHFDFQIPVTYAGGVTEMADLERIKTAGLDGVNVTVGSALDSICLQEVVA